MPNCFQLVRKANKEAGPVPLAALDEEICRYLGTDPDPVLYYCGWFDVIGYDLAQGRDFTQIKQRLVDRTWFDPDGVLFRIADYLDNHFIPVVFAEVGRKHSSAQV